MTDAPSTRPGQSPGPSSPWCCPQHHGAVEPDGGAFVARCCQRRFPVVGGIPDFRVALGSWLDVEEDRRRAEELLAAVPEEDVAGSVRFVFARRPGWTPELIERRVEQVLSAPARLRAECEGWLRPACEQDGPILDLGCGPGMLLAALRGRPLVIGVDVSLEWLVVARRMSRAAGVEAQLAAGLAEALPLAAGSVGAVCALDVLEHVGDQAAMVRETDRILRVGGVLVAATPNRFSLAAEPHVNVWGVGWLPRAWQAAYVTRRSGHPYAFTRLLSAREIAALLRDHSSLRGTPQPAAIPAAELGRMRGRRRVLAVAYNRLVTLPGARSLARHLGAFFHLVAYKERATGESRG